MRDGHQIVFRGEADEYPGMDTGDVIITVHAKPHPRFQRRGDNLCIRKRLTLREALCGYVFPIVHLDGRTLVCQNRKKKTVTRPNSMKVVVGEGFPTWNHPFKKGHLFIRFEVRFPTELSADVQDALASVLPGPASHHDRNPHDIDVEATAALQSGLNPWGKR
jgi:DnaJ family protein A protein 2